MTRSTHQPGREREQKRKSVGTRSWVTRVWAHTVLAPAAALAMIPLLWLLITSIKSPRAWARDVFWPTYGTPWTVAWDELTLDGYRRLFGLGDEGSMGLMRALINSLFVASTVSVVSAILCAGAGYALARRTFRGQTVLSRLVLVALVVPPPMLIAAQYDLLFHMGLLDTYLGFILPLLAPAFGVYLFRQAAMRAVPAELVEAARIDGASELRIFTQVALPLLRPMIGAFILITFMATWNNFITPQVVLQSPEKLPLAVFIANLRSTMYQDLGLIMAATVVSVLPVAVVFVLMQREFISGLTEGAVRG